MLERKHAVDNAPPDVAPVLERIMDELDILRETTAPVATAQPTAFTQSVAGGGVPDAPKQSADTSAQTNIFAPTDRSAAGALREAPEAKSTSITSTETVSTTIDESQSDSTKDDVDTQKSQEYNKSDANVGEVVQSVEAEVATQQQNINNVAKPIRITCIRQDLAGKRHPNTEVLYTERSITIDGQQYIVVAPEFDSAFDTQLSDELRYASSKTQKAFSNMVLKMQLEHNPTLRGIFSDIQLEQISKGLTPNGFVWHHDVEVGRMQLVDATIHRKTGHTGGRKIWGGGRKRRK